MKKWILVLILFLLGCGKESDFDKIKIKNSQNLLCNGLLNEQESKNGILVKNSSSEVEYKMTVKNWEKEFKSIIGKTIGNIDIKEYGSFPICFESEFQYTFFPSCDVSSYGEKLPNSKHLGLIDKVSGKVSYEKKYDLDNVTYRQTLLLDCKPINELVIK